MRKKLMLLSVLTCLSGGWALLGPAEAQSQYPSCWDLVGTSCPANSPYQYCTSPHGTVNVLICMNGEWTWA